MLSLPRPVPSAVLFLTLGLSLVIGACTRPSPVGQRASTVPSPSGVAKHRTSGKPALALIERDGDGGAALALAVAHPGHAASSTAFAALVAARLEQSHLEVQTQAFAGGFLLTTWAPLNTEVIEQLRSALFEPLSSAELRRYAPAEAQPEGDLCGAQGLLVGLPQLQALLGYGTAAISVVGPSAAVQAARDAYQRGAPWPTGQRLDPDWPAADMVFTRSGVGTELSVALRTQFATRLEAAGEALRREDSLLQLLVRRGNWQVPRVHAGIQRTGGCLGVSLRHASPQSPETLTVLARQIAGELRRALDESEEAPLSQWALAASDPEAAAALAAWTALHTPSTAPERWVLRYTGDNPRAFEAHSRHTALQPKPPFPATVQIEPGQGRIWAFLSHPCPAHHESAESAGHTAAALLEIAGSEAHLDAWISERGLGIVAQEAAFHPFAPERLAERLTRHLLRPAAKLSSMAWAGDELSHQLPGDGAWEVALNLASEGHPSWLFPPGAASSVLAVSAEQGRAALDAYLRGPLSLSILAPSVDAATRFRIRLAELLASSPGAECPARSSSSQAPLAGEYLVASAESTAYLVWMLSPDANLEAADLLTHLLNRPRGWLAEALVAQNLAESGHARVLGLRHNEAVRQGYSSALIVSVTAPAPKLQAAIQQTRALLQRVQGSLPRSEEFAAARREWQASARFAGDPRERLLRLQYPRGPVPSLTTVREFAAKHLTEAGLILVRPLPVPD